MPDSPSFQSILDYIDTVIEHDLIRGLDVIDVGEQAPVVHVAESDSDIEAAGSGDADDW